MNTTTTIPVFDDEADLTDPRTTFWAWDANGIICTDECDGTREQAIEHARAFLTANPGSDVYVLAYIPEAF